MMKENSVFSSQNYFTLLLTVRLLLHYCILRDAVCLLDPYGSWEQNPCPKHHIHILNQNEQLS